MPLRQISPTPILGDSVGDYADDLDWVVAVLERAVSGAGGEEGAADAPFAVAPETLTSKQTPAP